MNPKEGCLSLCVYVCRFLWHGVPIVELCHSLLDFVSFIIHRMEPYPFLYVATGLTVDHEKRVEVLKHVDSIC